MTTLNPFYHSLIKFLRSVFFFFPWANLCRANQYPDEAVCKPKVIVGLGIGGQVAGYWRFVLQVFGLEEGRLTWLIL